MKILRFDNIILVLMSWLASFKGKNKKLKSSLFPNFEALRSKIKDVFKLLTDDFQLVYEDEDKSEVALEDEGDFDSVRNAEKLRIVVKCDEKPGQQTKRKKPDPSEISKGPKQEMTSEEGVPSKKEEMIQSKWENKEVEQGQAKKEEEEKDGDKKGEKEGEKEGEKTEEKEGQQGAEPKFPPCTKEIPENLMYKIGDKPVNAEYVMAESPQQLYFACQECQKKYADGPRYRCDTCPNYDICHFCFKEDIHDVKEHAMNFIENRDLWQKYDFRFLLQAFVDPYFTWFEPDAKNPVITQKDIMTNEKIYFDMIDDNMEYYKKKFDRYAEKWFYRFQEIQEIREERRRKELQEEEDMYRKDDSDSDYY